MSYEFHIRSVVVVLFISVMSCSTTSSQIDKPKETTKHAKSHEPSTRIDEDLSIEESYHGEYCPDDVYSDYLKKDYRQKNQSTLRNKSPKQIEQSSMAYAREILQGPTKPYFGGIPVVSNSHVERWIRHFKGDGKQTFIKWLVRSQSYRDLVVPLLIQEGLPPEFFYMAMIESGFSNTAASSKSATGTWQFMKGTARIYDLKIDHWTDERRDPVKSTIAAARYLRDLYGIFGDWYLAMAAYNAGPGKIKRAIHLAGSRDFWAIVNTKHIKPETKNYVPKMLAALHLSMNAKENGFDVGTDQNHEIPLSTVSVDRPLSIREVADQLGITESQLRSWNPELIRDITPPRRAKTYELRLSQPVVTTFEQIRERLSEIQVTDIQMHRILHGDTLSSIAKKYRVQIAKIREMNPTLDAKALRVGREIAIPIPGIVTRTISKNDSEQMKDHL
jgi:membrane-bound lytic murein transglycosylase D